MEEKAGKEVLGIPDVVVIVAKNKRELLKDEKYGEKSCMRTNNNQPRQRGNKKERSERYKDNQPR